MAERLSDKLREFLTTCEGKTVSIDHLRKELKIDPNSAAWDGIREYMRQLIPKKIVKPSGLNDGVFKVIKQVDPVKVFLPDRERRPVFNLNFPCDFDTKMEMDFAESIVVREGDLITLGGVKSKGKTFLCLHFCAENLDKNPVLMGNEYTILVNDSYEPSARFLNRLDKMSEWIKWTDEKGEDKFTLYPIREDYAEHIVPNRVNIIDWINLDGDKSYDIGKVLEDIKASLGRGVAIIGLQKGEGMLNPRGGQFVRDFSDLEILLDGFGDSEDDILLTIKGCKEKTKPIVGHTYAYTITHGGTKMINFREVIKCSDCFGKGWKMNKPCEPCRKSGYIDK